MKPLTKYYTQVFGMGLGMGGLMELFLIKSNYYQMLAASEAKQRLKELEQEREDADRLKRIIAANGTNASTAN
ncbi:hypothetical protein BDF20DRAFT_913712 [Mycotypha africana]|uniref:uncharacterized protein n=1 Tax=Mycotypha africana TaxID=64632 RepID=UPI00230079F2|nr:uncharacterized protein BDF20DRAFT_913712 [Mycotypha africana]KAI8977383.1 hypothetical protein BDF20DRAFT_913712 [Mycotypha africana]